MPALVDSRSATLYTKEGMPTQSEKGTILVIEDDTVVSSLLSQVLGGEGYQVKIADTVYIGRNALKSTVPSLVILDRKLPDADGLELCAEIRKIPAWRKVPILFLTAMSSVADKISGLKSGGDDYLGKPFSSSELVARVEALLRRSGDLSQNNILEAAEVKLDLDARKAFLKDAEIVLWQKEFDLLACLIQHKNRVLTRAFLLQQVWDYAEDNQPSTKVVDVMISHLRSKLGVFGNRIAAVRGMGYRLDV